MKHKNLKSSTENERKRIKNELEYILFINKQRNILSRTDISIINIWIKQIKESL